MNYFHKLTGYLTLAEKKKEKKDILKLNIKN